MALATVCPHLVSALRAPAYTACPGKGMIAFAGVWRRSVRTDGDGSVRSAGLAAAASTGSTAGDICYSDRQLAKGADAMNLSLDNWVAASPRSTGWIITVAGLVLVGTFGIMASGIR